MKRKKVVLKSATPDEARLMKKAQGMYPGEEITNRNLLRIREGIKREKEWKKLQKELEQVKKWNADLTELTNHESYLRAQAEGRIGRAEEEVKRVNGLLEASHRGEKALEKRVQHLEQLTYTLCREIIEKDGEN